MTFLAVDLKKTTTPDFATDIVERGAYISPDIVSAKFEGICGPAKCIPAPTRRRSGQGRALRRHDGVAISPHASEGASRAITCRLSAVVAS
jgi:hypothetical protein